MRAPVKRLAVVALTALVGAGAASAKNGSAYFSPGNLVVSRGVYDNNRNNILVGAILPPNRTTGCVTAIADGLYPSVSW